MELKAVDEPMLIRERSDVVMNVTKIELNGKFQVGETRANQEPQGSAPSRAKANNCLQIS